MKQSVTGYISLGGVVKPHGIRGEFCIKSYADSPSIFGDAPALYLQEDKKSPKPITVTSWREHKGLILLTVKGVTDRDQAELLRGRSVLVREEDLPELEEGEHYFYQMIGCRVVLADDTEVGVLKGFYETGEQDIWVIENAAKTEILLPAVPEFVVDIDLDNEIIVIEPPEGLLDLYLNPEPPKKKKAKRRTSKKKPRRNKGGEPKTE
ncbi:ribosome maturation factor RimM [Pseudodesulfovibrio sediminis]|uniref:Ribosome maturation factor RimM n=1 Tax=Pseudodesulfovibrio sediminis TaxID=2810563 RepID=A0ABN6EQ52_9BACT|nr:ribosome maturation factor RimM [Pseudodesulfovibrio sediminis]BCS88538.1 ribosome maturation factor RimM [Pseudodesulfovibrio sediminis]